MVRQRTPESLPILSRGKHRNPRKGACFMEMASVLSGERWSDHPACTHTLLAHLARLVNDHTTDVGRDRLAIWIPSVVGLTGGGERWVVGFTGQVALHALPDVPEHAQRALAAGLVRVRQLRPVVGAAPLPRDEEVEAALARVPSALRWLRRFDVDRPIPPRTFVTRSAPSVVTAAVVGLAEHGADPDARLRELLVTSIEAAEVLQRFEAPVEIPATEAAAPEVPAPGGGRDVTRPRSG